MPYRSILCLSDLQAYLSGATIVAFDFETAPDDSYRNDDRAALDAHKSHIVGISFSVAEGDAVYLPLTHRVGQNAAEQDAIWAWLKPELFMNPAVTKVVHNLAFESAFLYARGIVVQEPCYDTIAAAQLVYKREGVPFARRLRPENAGTGILRRAAAVLYRNGRRSSF